MICVKTGRTKKLLRTVLTAKPRRITVITARSAAILCNMISIPTATAGAWLGLIVHNYRLANNMDIAWDVIHETHTRHSHTTVEDITNLVTTKGKDMAILRKPTNDNSVRHFVRTFVDLDKDSMELGVSKKNFKAADSNTTYFKDALLFLKGAKRDDPRAVGITTLDRCNGTNINASFVKTEENVMAGTYSVNREVN